MKPLSSALLTALAVSVSIGALAQAEDYPMEIAEEAVYGQLAKVEEGIGAGPYDADWESLKAFRVPEWFRDAKFGIFIHWGAYSVPAFANEWYTRNMYEPRNPAFTYHRNVYGPQSEFGYKDFIPMFKAEQYDPAQWVDLFQGAGAKYMIFVAEHCDGFAMYDSDMTRWDASEMGPMRDTAGELRAAATSAGMHFALSNHRAENWWWYGVGRTHDSDVNDPANAGLYGAAAPRALPADQDGRGPSWSNHLENWMPPSEQFLDDWLARVTEIVDKYQPELIYLDWWTSAPAFQPYLEKFAAYYYNSGKRDGYDPAIVYKGEQFQSGTALFDVERGKLGGLRLEPWQSDTSVSTRSWGYIQNDSLRTAKSLTQNLVDIVSKNGNLLLNVGPKSDGTIPQDVQDILLDIGAWLEVNGEAIYETRPWVMFGEGPTTVATGEKSEQANEGWTAGDIRFTAKDGTLYAIGLEPPVDRKALIKVLYEGTPYLEKEIAKVALLGGGRVSWRQTAQGLEVTLPRKVVAENMPYTLRITFKG